MTAVKKAAAPAAKKAKATTKKAVSPSPGSTKAAATTKKASAAGKGATTATKKASSVTTKAVTTKAASTKAASTKAATTKAVTTKAASTKAATTKTAAPATVDPVKAAIPEKAVAAKKVAPAPPKRPTTGPYAKEPKFLDEQRVLLLEERSIYQGQAVDLRAEADSLALEREPGDVQFDEESGEGGTVTVDRERNLALSAQAGLAVEEIDDAMRKIDRKSYGGCERCFQPIPKARLRALPFARLCVACKSGGLSRR